MNFRSEPFPSDIAQVIGKCNDTFDLICKKLQDDTTPLLGSFFKSANGKVKSVYKENPHVSAMINTFREHKAKSGRITRIDEIKGIYVFGEIIEGTVVPVYIGISGSILRRLKQHAYRKLNNEATLAYLIARTRLNYQDLRASLPLEYIELQQQEIRQFKVIIVPETDDYQLYFMEVYLAGLLKCKWNSFKTH